jgi:hypothetical protein
MRGAFPRLAWLLERVGALHGVGTGANGTTQILCLSTCFGQGQTIAEIKATTRTFAVAYVQ